MVGTAYQIIMIIMTMQRSTYHPCNAIYNNAIMMQYNIPHYCIIVYYISPVHYHCNNAGLEAELSSAGCADVPTSCGEEW